MYFSYDPSAFRNYSELSASLTNEPFPSALQLVAVRPTPPPLTSDRASLTGLTTPRVHAAYYRNGLFLGIHSISEDVDTVASVETDMGTVLQSFAFSENISSLVIEGKTWDIDELPSSDSSDLMSQSCPTVEGKRRLAVLTNAGITLLKRRRPVDILQKLLAESNGQQTPALKAFFNNYGVDQACAMCLSVACGHPTSSNVLSGLVQTGMSPKLKNPSLAIHARTFFFELGGKPTLNESFRPTTEHGHGLGKPIAGPDYRFSGRHNGICLYLARILKPIWRKEIFIQKGGVIDGKFAIKQLYEVKENLESLQEFFAQNQFFTKMSPGLETSRFQSKPDIEAAQAEQESLQNIHVLLTQSLEGLNLILMLLDRNANLIFQKATESTRRDALTVNFESLITTPKGRDTAKSLVSEYVKKQMEQLHNVDAISEALRQKCPSFCTTEDAIFYKGIEYVNKAKKSTERSERIQCLLESQRLFLSISDNLTSEQIDEITTLYKMLNFFTGIVELLLDAANKQDPAGLGLSYYLDGDRPISDSRLEFYNRRIKFYYNLFSVLNGSLPAMSPSKSRKLDSAVDPVAEQNEAFKRAITSKDELFHYILYEWLIEQGKYDRLLQIEAPFLEFFLNRERSRLEIIDLLWQLYVRQGKFLKAAKILGHLAESDMYGLKLPQRMEYLARAIANSKSVVNSLDVQDAQFVHDMEERMEVAKVQNEAYMAVKNMPDQGALLSHLEARFYDVTDLYNQVARPLQLHELTLAILHTSDYKDQYLVEKTWTEIIQQAKEKAVATSLLPLDVICEKVKELGRKYYPSEVSMPLNFLVQMLEVEAYESNDIRYGIVYRTFREVGVPFHLLFRIYNDIYETKIPPWHNPAALVYLMQSISNLLEVWTEALIQPNATMTDK